MTAAADRAPAGQPNNGPLRRYLLNNRAALAPFAVFIVMMAIFLRRQSDGSSPPGSCTSAVLVTLPVALFLVVPGLRRHVGEIDLAFPATMGFSRGSSPSSARLATTRSSDVAAIIVGMVLGFGSVRSSSMPPLLADRDPRHELHAARPSF